MIPGLEIVTAPESLCAIQKPDATGWTGTVEPVLQGTLVHDNPVTVRIYKLAGWDPGAWDVNNVETRLDFEITDQVTDQVIRSGFLATMPGPDTARFQALPLGLMLKMDGADDAAEGDEITWSVLPFRMAGPMYESLDVSAAIGAAGAIPRVEQLEDSSLQYNTLVDGHPRPLEGPRTQSWRMKGGLGEDVRGQLQAWREELREVVFYPPWGRDTRLLAHFQDDLLPEIGGHGYFIRGDNVAWYERVPGEWGRVSGDFPRFMPSPWEGRALVVEGEAENIYFPSSPISAANMGPTSIPSSSGHVVSYDEEVSLPVDGHTGCLRWRRGTSPVQMQWAKTLTAGNQAWVFSIFVKGATGIDGSGVPEIFLHSNASTYTSTTRAVLTDQWQRIFIHGIGGTGGGTSLVVNMNADSTPAQAQDLIYLDGWMLEEVGAAGGSDHGLGLGPSGYIHTTDQAVTREDEDVRVYCDDIPGDQGFLSFWTHHVPMENAYVGSGNQQDSIIMISNGPTARLEIGIRGRSSPDDSGYYVEARGSRLSFYGNTGVDFPEAFQPIHLGVRWKPGGGNDLTIALFVNGVKLDEFTGSGTDIYPTFGQYFDLGAGARGLPIGELRMDRTALTDAEVLAYYEWMTGERSRPLMQALLGRRFVIGRIKARPIAGGTHQVNEVEVPLVEGTVRPEFQAIKAREDITRGRI